MDRTVKNKKPANGKTKAGKSRKKSRPAKPKEPVVEGVFVSRAGAYLNDAIESISGGLALFDADDRLVICNNRFRDLPVVAELAVPGTRFEEIVKGCAQAGLFGGTRKEQKAIIKKRLQLHRNTPSSHEMQLVDGRWIEIRESKTHDGGTVLLWTNISDRKMADDQQKGRSKVLERLATGGSLEEVLSLLVATLEGMTPGMLGSVLILDDSGERLRTGAAPRLPDFYNKAVDGIRIGPKVGSCGAAAFTGKTVIAEDIMTHPNWKEFKKIAAKAGLRACWSQPIFSASGEVLGTFAMYHPEPKKPTDRELKIIEDSAQLAGIAIEHKRMEGALKNSEERFKSIIEYAPGALVIKGLNGRIETVNKTYCDWYGMEPSALAGKKGHDFLDRKTATKVAAHEREVANKLCVIEEERRLTYPTGITRDVQSQKFPIFGPDGKCIAIGTLVNDITGRKRAEAVNTRLGRIIEQSLSEIYMFDAKTLRFVQVNHGARQNLDYTMEELKDLTPADIKPEFTKRQFEKTIKPLRDGKQEQLVFETVHQRKDGSTYDVLVHLQLMQQETPAVFVANIQDITERKKMREALRSSEERLRGAIDSMQEGFALFDRDDRLVAINDEYRRLVPVAEEIFQKNGTFEELLRANVYQERILEAVGREEEFIKIRMEQHRNPGKPIIRMISDGSWYLLSETRTPEGGVATAVTDISELKDAEAALRLSEEKFREIAEVSSDLFWEMDETLCFTYLSDPKQDANPNAPVDMLGKTRWELAGAEPDTDGLWKRHRSDLLAHKPFRNFRHSLLGKDGTNLYRVCSGVPIFDGNGDFRGYRGSATDITEFVKVEDERHRALAAAEEASRAKSEFLATVSHELRTPLNAILGFAEIISRQILGATEKNKYIEYAADIHTSGEYLLELVNDILDISTIEAGKRPLSKEKLSINETISECAKSVSARAGENGITLSTRVPKDLPPIHADKRAVKQVLINLLSNAVKFTPPGGMITVQAQAKNGTMTIKVSDTGPGIPEEDIATLLAPFERGDIDPYVAQDGAGLGLAISDSLIKLHDGELEIKSAPGQGTTVSITLPQGNP